MQDKREIGYCTDRLEKVQYLLRVINTIIERVTKNSNISNLENRIRRSSYKERKGNALAPGAEEGRSDLRKATGSRKQASIRGYPNGATRQMKVCQPAVNKIAVGGEPPELKHLSRARKRNQTRFRK